MNKINLQSEDILTDTLKKLKEIYTRLFDDEGNLNITELENLSKKFASTASGKYEFNWAGKMNAKRNAYKVSKANLKPDKERSINFDETNNLIIEGDNLEVLKLLQKSYANKVKCIYIDPPYNTGNDFIYKDNFTEGKHAYWEQSGVIKEGIKLDTNTESQGRYHSNWLNMIYPRLLLARTLLKDDGVIFVSIDDHEVYNLRLLMNEVFGEENFLATFVWRRRASSALADKLVSVDHEYVVAYQRGDFQSFYGKPKDYSSYNNPDNDPNGDWTLGDLTVGMTKDQRPNQFYDLVDPNTGRVFSANPNRVWAFIPESMARLVADGRVVFPEDNEKRPMVKRYKNNLKSEVNPISTWIKGVSEISEQEDVIELETGLNAEGTRLIQELFGATVFSYSKPVSLIKSLIRNSTDSNDIILDFFAGSGTTAQAIIELNKENNRNLKYILVQVPEATNSDNEAYKIGYKTISDLCIERVKNVIKALRNEYNGQLFANYKDLDLGFKVFSLSPSYFPENTFNPDPEKSEEDNLRELEEYVRRANEQLQLKFNEEGILYELMLKDGFDLNFKKEKLPKFTKNDVFRVIDPEKEAIVCIDSILSDETLELLGKYTDKRLICLERAIDTTKKWNLKNMFGSNLWVA